MTTHKNIFRFGLCAAALMTAIAVAPAWAETTSTSGGASTSTGVGVRAAGVGVNADTGVTLGTQTSTTKNAVTQARGRMNDELGSSTYARTRVNTAADQKLDLNNNGFIDENEMTMSTSARTAANTNVEQSRPRDIGNMGIRAHATSDNRIGASYGND